MIMSVESPEDAVSSHIELGMLGNSTEIYGACILNTERMHSGVNISQEEWTHFVLVWNNTKRVLKLYINGRAKEAKFSEARAKNEKRIRSNKDFLLVIGRGKLNGKMTEGWDGQVADVRVWDRVLEEVSYDCSGIT